MKKIIGSAILLVASSSAMAVAPGGPNCGWGNMLFEGGSGLPHHMVATTTNGTSGNATFGMTSGTNGCSTSGKLTYGGKRSAMDLTSILDEFSEDVAKGHGEALDTVAAMIGVDVSDKAVFSAVMHDNFAVIFPNENVTAQEVLVSVNELLKTNGQLAKYAA
ncbi:MAG: hypothetical protein COB26_05535 [Piscirickettsiaceae bacterium]|nr:MAG: hypothetical protein COB26_05535 [Piscirickettsiaceae bacterium]